jgi:steroid delta-isomerase
MPSAEAMIAAVHAYVDAFACGDAGAAAALFADDASVEDPVGTPQRVGKAAITDFYRSAMETGAKLELTGPVRTAADYAAFAFEVTLDWRGQRQRIDVIDIFRFDGDGKISEMRAFFGSHNMHAA